MIIESLLFWAFHINRVYNMWSFVPGFFFFLAVLVFVAFFKSGFSLAVASGAYSLLRCWGFSCRPQAQAPNSTWASVAVAQRLSSCGSKRLECGLLGLWRPVFVAPHGVWIFLDWRLELGPHHRQADSYPLRPRGSPASFSLACCRLSPHCRCIGAAFSLEDGIILHCMAMQYASATLQAWYQTPK